MLTPIKMTHRKLSLLDQRKLPESEDWITCQTLEDAAKAIETMVVRGAPAIGCAAAFAILIDSQSSSVLIWGDYLHQFEQGVSRLAATRPTAVNLFYALDKFKNASQNFSTDTAMTEVISLFESIADGLYHDDIATCQAIGKHGLDLLSKNNLRIITHCNAGALATAAYGTALGVIRSLHEQSRVEMVYVDETRPWLQGARLTAYEMVKESIPHLLVADSVAASLMKDNKIDFAVVGADRIAANGDVANKIGTYSLAVNARYHGVKFFVAAPKATFDLNLTEGSQIPIEQRSSDELLKFHGRQVAPTQTDAYNPSFDVTPHELVDGIVTEDGVLYPPYTQSIAKIFSK